MRRNVLIGVALVVLLAGIGLGAYNMGLSRGVAEQLESSGRLVPIDGPGFGHGYGVVVTDGTTTEGGTEVVRVIEPAFGRGYGYGPGFWFFPFGLLWFGLIVFGFLALARGWRRGGWGSGPGRLDDWHRRQHEQPSVTNVEDR
jgi:hypothetical protein